MKVKKFLKCQLHLLNHQIQFCPILQKKIQVTVFIVLQKRYTFTLYYSSDYRLKFTR